MSAFELQVVRRGTKQVVASWPPGSVSEKDLIAAIIEKVRAKGVGVFRTEARVVSAVREAVEAALLELKTQVRP